MSPGVSAVTKPLLPLKMMPAPFGTYREVAQLLLPGREQTVLNNVIGKFRAMVQVRRIYTKFLPS